MRAVPHRSHRRAAAGGTRRRGLTMAELLIVMTIGVVLLSLTVASFSAIGKRASREGAAETVIGLLRQAQHSAVNGGRGAMVRVDSRDRSLYGLSTAALGAWHFEEALDTDSDGIDDTTPGARLNDGDLNGTPSLEDGRIGLALRFDGSTDFVDCGRLPVWDQTDGIRLEAWVWPDSDTPGADRHIISKAPDSAFRGYFIGLEYSTADEVVFEGGFAVDNTTTPLPGGGVFLKSKDARPYAVGRWYHVAAEFDGFEGRLFVNGVMVDLDSYRWPEDAPTNPAGASPNPVDDPNSNLAPDGYDAWWDAPEIILPARGQALEVGRGNTPGGLAYLTGLIDEPMILSIAGGSRIDLPEGVSLGATEPVIHFDGAGRLDVAYHSGPVYIAVGDPYQSASLAAVPYVAGNPVDLQGANPFPPNGGLVMLNDLLIDYSSVSGAGGLTLDINSPSDVITLSGGIMDDTVRFARLVNVTPAGVVRRLDRLP